MKQSLCDLSITFAANVIRLFDNIHNRPNIKNQLLRSSSSVGANIHEAQYGYSTEDFVYKLQLALKECNESEYWLELFFLTKCIAKAFKLESALNGYF